MIAAALAAVVLVSLTFLPACADDAGAVVIDPAKPIDHWLAATPDRRMPIVPDQGLLDLPAGQIGWFEYGFEIAVAGWYRLDVAANPHVGHVELDIDPAPLPPEGREAVRGGLRVGEWVWLEPGAHRLRFIKNYWTGLPRVTAIRIAPRPVGQEGVFHVLNIEEQPVTALGHCVPIRIETAGTGRQATLVVEFRRGDAAPERREIAVPATDRPIELAIEPPCAQAGDVTAVLSMPGDRPGAKLEAVRRYSVFDLDPVEPGFRRGDLVAEIDAVAREPDFVSGATEVVHSPAGDYRQSGDRGTTPFARRRLFGSPPGWFAYRIDALPTGRPYLFEVVYPDDAPRTFVALFRGGPPRDMLTSIGAETGGVWPLSNRMQHMDAVIWPGGTDARVVVLNIHDGLKAAISRIRIFALDAVDGPASPKREGRRDVTVWSEEGDSFRFFGGKHFEPQAVYEPVDRYLRLARSMGATRITPTVGIYGFQLYPSRLNLAFNRQSEDLTAAFLLGAQRFGMTMAPELHLRADEVLWSARTPEEFDRRLLLSGQGAPNLFDRAGKLRRPPYFNALDPYVRRWYRDVVVELARRYRDYPAFKGVQLRVSGWANSSLNNLVSLDWGYDSATVRRFLAETATPAPPGLDLNADTLAAASMRRDFLMAEPRERWIAWRCEQMRDIFQDMAGGVRAIRPDLKIFLHVSGLGEPPLPDRAGMRGMGIDPQLLGAVDGLEILDGRLSYGGREVNAAWRQRLRDMSRQPGLIDLFAPAGGRPSTLDTMQYIEIPDFAWPLAQLGWPSQKREIWASSPVDPPGRLKLARYAELVGLSDVYMLGDGGNGYVFGGEGVADFMREFTALPRVPMRRVAGIPEPLIVRESDGYASIINLSDKPVRARLKFAGRAKLRRLTDGSTLAADEEGGVVLDLKAYELRTFSSGRGAAVRGAEILP